MYQIGNNSIAWNEAQLEISKSTVVIKMLKTLLFDKTHVNGVILREQNLFSKVYWQKGLDLFKEVLWVSVGQRAAKSHSVKLWGWSHCQGINPHLHACGSTRVWQQIIFSNLQIRQLITLQPFDRLRPKVPLWKELNAFANIISGQETGSILKIGFALSICMFTVYSWSQLYIIFNYSFNRWMIETYRRRAIGVNCSIDQFMNWKNNVITIVDGKYWSGKRM